MEISEFRNLINEYESNTIAHYFLYELKSTIFYPKQTLDLIYKRQGEIWTLLMNACVDEFDSAESEEE